MSHLWCLSNYVIFTLQCVGKVGEIKSVRSNGVVELSMNGTSDTPIVLFNKVLLTTETAPVDPEEEEGAGGISIEEFKSFLQSGLCVSSLQECLFIDAHGKRTILIPHDLQPCEDVVFDAGPQHRPVGGGGGYTPLLTLWHVTTLIYGVRADLVWNGYKFCLSSLEKDVVFAQVFS